MNSQLLKSYIIKFDGNQEKLADAIGMSLSRLNAKINEHNASFNQREIAFIKDRYHLDDKELANIFFVN